MANVCGVFQAGDAYIANMRTYDMIWYDISKQELFKN